MKIKDETEELLLIEYNNKIVRLLRSGLSWRGISNKEVSRNLKIPESRVSKFLNEKFLSKKIYYRTVTIFSEMYDPIELFKEMIESFDVIDYEIEEKIKILQEKQKVMNDLNRIYCKINDPYSGN